MGNTNHSRTVRCSKCGVTLVVPAYARNICCSLCHRTTYVGRDPVRHAVGFVKSIVSTFSNSGNSFNNLSPHSTQNSRFYTPTSYPRVFGNKRALLIGIAYASCRYELKGTINDVNCVAYLLAQKFGFPRESILILTGTWHFDSLCTF